MKLYSYWRSSSSWRVRIALAHKGIDYDYAAVHLVQDGGQQRQEWFRELNAAGQVPLLEVEEGGVTHRIGQSLAILAYLEEVYPEPAFLPADLFQRAQARQLAELVNAGIQPMQNLSVIQKLKGMDLDAKAWCQEFIASGLAAYERTAASTAGQFSVGDAPSWADACLVPQLYNARRFALDLTPYPTVLAVEANCLELAAFRDSRPEAMPDADV